MNFFDILITDNIKEDQMATLTISVEEIADSISHMNKNELETLTLILSEEGKEILKRKKEIEQGKITPLSRDKVFDV